MAEINIFEYNSYRQYLRDYFDSKGVKSGAKKRAAVCLAVHTTFVSQVVLGKAELSLDQAEKMNQFLKHSDEESDHFINLVVYGRASDEALKKRFEKKINQSVRDRNRIDKRIEKDNMLTDVDGEKFYSSYIYGLLHVLSSIPKFQTRECLVKEVGFSETVVNNAIDFMLKIGVLKQDGIKIIPGEKHIHLKTESKMIWQHHVNWRLATMQNLSFKDIDDLHYSLVFSCSESDIIRIKEDLLNTLKKINKTINLSPEEVAYVFCMDFFKWK